MSTCTTQAKLFQGKGKKAKKSKKAKVVETEDTGLKLVSVIPSCSTLTDIFQPSGEPATIKFITVGGRTSAYVEELQHLNAKTANSEDIANVAANGEESDLTQLSEEDAEETKTGGKRKKVRGRRMVM